jgi:LysM repeat protein
VPPAPGDPSLLDSIARQCPFLVSADGAWRGAGVTREHHCAAVAPPAPLAAEKQRRLCLTADHAGCATYLAAQAASGSIPGRAPGLPRPIARTAPVILDHGRFSISIPAFRSDRSTGQTVLVAILILAFVAVVIAKLSGVGGSPAGFDRLPSPAATSSGSAAPSATPRPTATPTALPTSSAATSTAPSASAATGPAASPRPSAATGRTYVVKANDTLISIANRFGTTTREIIRLNKLTSPSNLKIGQVLQLPS